MTEEAREPVYVVAKFEYNASSEQELSLRKNERLRLLDDSKQWWKVENVRCQSGFVPSNYVKKEKPSLLNSLKRHVKRKTADRKISHISAPIPPAQSYNGGSHPTGVPNKPFTALVKFNYDPLKQDELQLKKGEYILVIEKSHDGWWKGQTKTAGEKGWFPSNYVKEMPYASEQSLDEHPRISGAYYAPAESPSPNEHIVRALYAYTAQSPDELAFMKDERLVVFDSPSSETNWFRARNDHGQIGLVPRNYVQDMSVVEPNGSVSLSEHSGIRTNGRHSGSDGGPNGPTHQQQQHDESVPEELSEELMHSLHLSNHDSGSSSARTSDPPTNALYDDFVDRPAIRLKPWYFGRLSRQDCDVLLNTYGSDGDFLIRDSETGSKADFSVSLKASPRNKHFRVYVNSVECHLTIGQRRFGSLDEMIGHYERHPICTNNDGRKLTLLHPLKAPRDFF
ncbi:Cytoplasmic protein NCK2 [Hypsibius exemplaris]|uniref:Cytoplasmic protein NCK2 n=1 Tax=Hypsibius exemplaris TaxID=2072580 RepID=A0A1W0X986_HYPEX|nr:Cytoplasmic protein NCK2 [Hypsibius exemplaris]